MLNKQLSNTLRRMETNFCKYTNNWYVETKDIEARLDFEETYKANAKMPIPSYDEMKKQCRKIFVFFAAMIQKN